MDHRVPVARSPSRRRLLRSGLALAGLSLLAGCQSFPFQAPPPRVPRIGTIRPGSAADPMIEAFRQGLQELGYTEAATSPSNGASPKAGRIASNPWPPSWPGLTWTPS
jgi:hypothetical protein